MRYIGFKRAYDIINKGGRLIKAHTNNSPHGSVFAVVSFHGKRHEYYAVSLEIAEKLQGHPMIVGSKDGLFPGMDQTWRSVAYG